MDTYIAAGRRHRVDPATRDSISSLVALVETELGHLNLCALNARETVVDSRGIGFTVGAPGRLLLRILITPARADRYTVTLYRIDTITHDVRPVSTRRKVRAHGISDAVFDATDGRLYPQPIAQLS